VCLSIRLRRRLLLLMMQEKAEGKGPLYRFFIQSFVDSFLFDITTRASIGGYEG
jgi:hypothetical protein